MWDWSFLGKILDWLRSPKQWFAVLLVTLALLILPASVLQRVGLQAFHDRYLTWIGLAALISAAVLVSESCAVGKRRVLIWLSHRVGKDYLRNLTTPEKVFLEAYIDQDTETQYAAEADGVVRGLAAKGLIYRSTSVSQPALVPTFAYNLQPWVRHFLKKHPELLKGTPPTPPGTKRLRVKILP